MPLFHTAVETLAYGTLAEALRDGAIVVTEVNAGGSVPDLKAINNADSSIFLLDGEELKGAKQNRVLNASVLMDAHSEIIIPVSCTEAGRWTHTSDTFKASGNVMSRNLRANRTRSVSASLDRTQQYRSDQSAVWRDIDHLAEAAAVESPTRAMTDIYAAKEKELDDCLDAFPHVPNQKGLIVFVNRKVMGFDLISRAAAYEVLHPKLVKSYVMDALLQKKVAAAQRRLTMPSHLSKRRNRVRKRGSNQQGSDGMFDLRAGHSSDLHSCTRRLSFTRRSSEHKMRRTVVEWRTTRDVLNTEQAVLHEILSRIAECQTLFKRALFQNVAQKAQQERSKEISEGGS